jgi:hypothetical protein
MHIKNSQQNFYDDGAWKTYGLQIYSGKTPRDFDPTFHMTIGRLAIIGALLVFICSYTYGIVTFGFVIGMTFGWLPAAAVAWLSIRLITYASHHVSS